MSKIFERFIHNSPVLMLKQCYWISCQLVENPLIQIMFIKTSRKLEKIPRRKKFCGTCSYGSVHDFWLYSSWFTSSKYHTCGLSEGAVNFANCLLVLDSS